MAETLKWPQSLQKQINTEKNKDTEKQPEYLKILIFLILIGAGMSLLTAIFTKDITTGTYLLLFWSFAVFMIIYGYKMFNTGIENNRVLKGLRGEAAVAHELDKLPEGWYIINDTVIKGSQIDHIAVGPAGLFCLETKNWNNAGCDEEGTWYHFHTGHWVPINKNPAEQNAAHAASLKKFLDEKLNTDIKVHSVIVLANLNGKFSIKSRVVPPDNTIICFTPELHRVLLEDKGTDLTLNEIQHISWCLAH